MQIEHIGDLEIFVQIVDRGSLIAAARSLDVTPNIVTRRLARLESQLGKSLLLRTTRSISLTEDGHRFYQHCQRILSEVFLAEDALVEGDTLRGILRVGIPTRLLHAKNILRIGQFLRQHPKLALQIVASDQPFDLLEQRIDVAIAVGPLSDSSFLMRRVTRFTNLGLAASAAYIDRCGRPQHLHELKNHQCLQFLTDHPQKQWILISADGKEHVIPVGGNFSSNDSRVLDTALRAGMGIGIVPNLEHLEQSDSKKRLPWFLSYLTINSHHSRFRSYISANQDVHVVSIRSSRCLAKSRTLCKALWPGTITKGRDIGQGLSSQCFCVRRDIQTVLG